MFHEPDGAVFQWIKEESKNKLDYVQLLNLMWSEDGADYDLDVYRRVASRLAENIEYWREITRAVNWRFTLVSYAAMLLTGEKLFFDELSERFNSSQITPQIGVALGLLHPERSQPFLETFIIRPDPQNAFAIISAHEVLQRLNSPVVLDFDAPAFISALKSYNQDYPRMAQSVIKQHWDFWGGVVPK